MKSLRTIIEAVPLKVGVNRKEKPYPETEDARTGVSVKRFEAAEASATASTPLDREPVTFELFPDMKAKNKKRPGLKLHKSRRV
jgi:hypothetical protein